MQSAIVKHDHNALQALVSELLQEQHLILVSNRGPMEYYAAQDGTLQPRRGSGGVVTALSGLTNHVDFTWIAAAMSEGDRRISEANAGRAIPSPLPGQRVSVRFVTTARNAYHKYYNVICNPLLWFIQHYMWSSPYTPRVDAAVYEAWENGYIKVNQEFADAAIEEAQQTAVTPLVMVHDYQLYLVPRMVREQLPHARIHQFVHIPWPAASYWELLPSMIRTAICDSLCHADIVGFQTERDVRAFLGSCAAFLPDVAVDYREGTVTYNGRVTRIRCVPDFHRRGRGSTAGGLAPCCRVRDETDSRSSANRPSSALTAQSPARTSSGASRLTRRCWRGIPELLGNVRFLAFLVPSRTHIRQYQRYLEEIDASIKRVNNRFGTDEWTPVQVFYENNYTQAIAGMRLYDVLLVNSVIDGMNLVAKEGPVVNRKDGVLILSEAAGAYEQLRVGALPVAPADIEGTTRALYEALTMSAEERKRRADLMVDCITREDITDWLYRQLSDISALAG